ncbi:DUF2993 domain-containing protein [Frankia sp. Ag45/Mut15]|uniref:DUF2993 domain-containing protein n=1 Tax=Frankia umida TaxID=573489 RepID=A0ABT0K1I0_9ACTN|nr:DUF2993 domain-containing protein [Frankia umida]MCK9877600.1 DUF2993 domain-containing protein [Frankia umida]
MIISRGVGPTIVPDLDQPHADRGPRAGGPGAPLTRPTADAAARGDALAAARGAAIAAQTGEYGPARGTADPTGRDAAPRPYGAVAAPGGPVAPGGPSGPGSPGGAPGSPGGAPATPTPPARSHRRRRVLAIVLAVLVVLFVVGDRVGVVIAKGQMRAQVKAGLAENLKPGDPVPTITDVSIGGFPFLTQVLFGKFTDIGVGLDGIPTPGPKISSVRAHLRGVHVPLGDALTDNVGTVPVDDVKATVGITYADLNAYLATQKTPVQVTPVDGGKQVKVTGTVPIPGFGSQQVGGVTTFEVTDNKLSLIPSQLTVEGDGLNFSIPVPGELLKSVLGAVPIPVSGLPFHLTIVDASTNGTGLSLTATAKDVVLPAA